MCKTLLYYFGKEKGIGNSLIPLISFAILGSPILLTFKSVIVSTMSKCLALTSPAPFKTISQAKSALSGQKRGF